MSNLHLVPDTELFTEFQMVVFALSLSLSVSECIVGVCVCVRVCVRVCLSRVSSFIYTRTHTHTHTQNMHKTTGNLSVKEQMNSELNINQMFMITTTNQ